MAIWPASSGAADDDETKTVVDNSASVEEAKRQCRASACELIEVQGEPIEDEESNVEVTLEWVGYALDFLDAADLPEPAGSVIGWLDAALDTGTASTEFSGGVHDRVKTATGIAEAVVGANTGVVAVQKRVSFSVAAKMLEGLSGATRLAVHGTSVGVVTVTTVEAAILGYKLRLAFQEVFSLRTQKGFDVWAEAAAAGSSHRQYPIRPWTGR